MADRRSLLDDEAEERRSIRDGMDVFDDEFEVDDFDLVADGFRPERRSGNSGESSRQNHDRYAPIIAAHYAASPVTPMRGSADEPSRESTRKSRTPANPFASPEDGEEAPLRRTPSGNFTTADIAHRSVSSASSNVYASTHSSRITAGGPSHPYGMYPQGTMARTPSVATQSTIRPQRNSSVRGGPAHPYTLYPQGVGDDEEDEHSSPQNLVPVGFPGLGQSYARQLGPEGEDQDLIGDFGHTEQLPPYTRFPEDGPEKPLLGVPDPPTALHSRAPVQGTDPGNPLMHTHIQPEQQESMSDESTLRRAQSTASRRSTMPPLEPTSSSESLMGNKSWTEKTWQERRRTRMLCGIPFIWLAIGLVVLLFTGALVGGVIGGYVVGKNKGTQSAQEADSTSMYDASLIATPTAVPLPTGTFALPFGAPEEPDSSCLVSAADAVSWSCEFGGDPNTMIEIGTTEMNNVTGAYLFPGITPTNELLYGIQVSSMETQFQPFLLVSDKDDPQNGHAYYFQTTYDKIVVLPGDALSGGESPSSRKIKRSSTSDGGLWPVKKQVAKIGDKPWFCYWNSTSIEGFFYGDRPIFSSTAPSSTSATPTMAPVGNYSAAAAYYSAKGSSPPWARATQTISTTIVMPSATGTYTGPANGLPTWLQANYPEYTATPTSPNAQNGDWDDDGDDDDDGGSGPPTLHRRGADDEDTTWMSGQSVPVFPYLVKIEERRKEGAPQPYCQQYQLLNDGTWNWIPDPHDDSKPITIQLEESVPSYSQYSSSQQRRKRTTQGGSCHCQWMSGLNS